MTHATRSRAARSRQEAPPVATAWLFESELGWMAIVGRGSVLSRVVFDHPSADSIWRELADGEVELKNWNPGLARRLKSYAAGREADFSDVELEVAQLAPFTRRVIAACRKVPYGATSHYAALAAAAGSPRAARAVGNAMRQNRWPLVVPCHRILAAGGRLGGYSARSGQPLKKRLLALEAKR